MVGAAGLELGQVPAHVAPPVWSTALMYAGFAMWGGALVADMFLTDMWIRRRLYWYTWLAGSALCGVALVFRGWSTALFGFGAMVFMGVILAIRWTPFLKIRGHIIAASYTDRIAETPPSIPQLPAEIRDTSARPLWWSVAGSALVLSGSRLALGWSLGTVLLTGLLTFIVALIGVDDGRRRIPFARRQYLQATLGAVLSLPVFGLPALAYAVAYRIGLAQPVSIGKHDAEARYYHGPDGTP